MLKAIDIASAKIGTSELNKEHILKLIDYNKNSGNPEINGLVLLLAEEIQMGRANGSNRSSKSHYYLGGDSVKYEDCYSDAQILLARDLFDNSSHLHCTFLQPPLLDDSYIKDNLYHKAQLQNIAHYFREAEGGNDSFKNWLAAQKIFIRSSIAYLTDIQDRLLKASQAEA
jgi:hypothetical protein